MDENIEFRLKNIEKSVERIIKILEGKDGLITGLALIDQRVAEIPSPTQLKFWSAAGATFVTATGLVFYLLWATVKGVFSGSAG